MTYEIKHHEQINYWIFWTDTIGNFVYGWTELTQVTDINASNNWTITDGNPV